MSMEGGNKFDQVCVSTSMVQHGDKTCCRLSLQRSNSCYEGNSGATSSYSDEFCKTCVEMDDNASTINKVISNGRHKC